MKRIFYSWLAATAIVIACKAAEQTPSLAEPQQARAELEKRHVAYDPDVFVEKAGHGDINTVELFLRAGMDANATNKYGSPALVWASGQGRVAVTQALLDKGADPAAEARDGDSPLTAAASEGQLKTAELLLAHGANVNARTQSGILPLIAAVREYRNDMV